MYINGIWKKGTAKLNIVNPATREVVGTVYESTKEDIQLALETSEKAFKTWRKANKNERFNIMMQVVEKIEENKDLLAATITKENGKTLAESMREVNITLQYFRWYAEEAKRIYGEMVPSSTFGQLANVMKQPIGPALAITPWNYPLSMIARKLAPALAAGCSMIIKPATKTPLTAIALFQCLEQTDLPKGVAQLVIGEPKSIGNDLIASPIIKKISFTGSTHAGLSIMQHSLTTVKKFSMELGGHAPFIVFESSDLEKAASDLIANKFANCGQACISTNRVYVHRNIYDQFAALLKQKAEQLRVGNGIETEVDMGPIISEQALQFIDEQVQDAVSKQAAIITGGKRAENLTGYFYEPTILGHVDEQMKVYYEETFGPVLPLISFENLDEIVAKANDSQYGLAAYVYTNQVSEYKALAAELEYGMIGFNSTSFIDISSPFGGLKNSGFGKEGGKYGLEEYLVEKLVSI